MENQWVKVLVFSLCACLGGVSPATAEMGVTELQDVLTLSKTVIQGQCLGLDKENQRYQLDVKRVLRGQMALGSQAIPYVQGQTPYVAPTPCLAFLNQNGQLQYLAVPAKADGEPDRKVKLGSLDATSLLAMIGFYDYFDSHVITPSVITLAQIENYFKTGKLTYSLKGNLYFFSLDKGDLTPSNTMIKATYELFSKTSTVQGLPIIAGLPYPPKVVHQGVFEPEIAIQYGDTQSERFFEVSGKMIGFDPTTQSIQFKFWVSFPMIYRESDFRHYIANSDLASSYVTIAITQEHGTRWTLTYNKKGDLADATLSGFRNQSFAIGYSSSYHLTNGFQDRVEAPLNGNGTLVLAIDPTKLSKFLSGGESLSRSSFVDLPLLQTLLKKPIECKVRVDGGTQPMPPTPCRLELDDIQFNTVSSQKRF